MLAELAARPTVKPAIIIDGMSGIGDCLHQRALIRPLLRKYGDVWLRTPWPQFYHDIPELRLSPLYRRDPARWGPWQIANEARSIGAFVPEPKRRKHKTINCRYPSTKMRSIVDAMADSCGVLPGSFQFPVPIDWLANVAPILDRARKSGRSLLVLRPITERANFAKGALRNPDSATFASLFKEIRKRFFVISIASLVEGEEWLVGGELGADLKFHRGELGVEQIIALISAAALVFCPVGFALVAAQAVGTPSVAVFGGHESAAAYAYGRPYAPMLAIEPIKPCNCFDEKHGCDKTIDLPKARDALLVFVADGLK